MYTILLQTDDYCVSDHEKKKQTNWNNILLFSNCEWERKLLIYSGERKRKKTKKKKSPSIYFYSSFFSSLFSLFINDFCLVWRQSKRLLRNWCLPVNRTCTNDKLPIGLFGYFFSSVWSVNRKFQSKIFRTHMSHIVWCPLCQKIKCVSAGLYIKCKKKIPQIKECRYLVALRHFLRSGGTKKTVASIKKWKKGASIIHFQRNFYNELCSSHTSIRKY